jgi:hypothetical protein
MNTLLLFTSYYICLVQKLLNDKHEEMLLRKERIFFTAVGGDVLRSNGDKINTAKSDGVWKDCVQVVDTQSINQEKLVDITNEDPKVDTDMAEV